MRNLLVLADFSEASDRAQAQAELLARPLGAEIHLFHKVVYPPPHPPTELLDRLDDAEKFAYVLQEVIEKPERDAREELERRRESISRAGIPVTVQLERSGDVFESIEAAIERLSPDLVVMGTHGRSGMKKWLMGSLAEKVLRHTRTNLLAVHADSPLASIDGAIGEMLVATDFSDCARRALDAAFRLARELAGSVALLHVIESPFVPIDGEGAAELVALLGEIEKRSRIALRSELGERQGTVLLASGHVAEQIRKVAQERHASMVIVGTHGRSGIGHAIIGSVAERVVRSCRLPVLVGR